MKEELRAALSLAADRIPGTSLVFYTRAPVGDGRFTWLAGRVEQVLGYPAEAFTSEAGFWRSVLHPADRDQAQSALSLASGRRSRDRVSLRYRIRTEGGEDRWIRDDLTVLRSPDGAPTEILGVIRDVTERHRLEGQVASLEERLWESQRMEALGILAGGIAHDFNNLLTTIFSSAQLIEESSDLDGEARDDLTLIRQAARKGAAMVRQILDFSGRSSGSATEVDVGSVVEGLESILTRTLGSDVELELERQDQLPAIHADGVRLEQVVLNLAVNAREAMPGGGTLKIRTVREDSEERVPVESGDLPPGAYVRLTIRDDGPGIPDHVRDQIFEPFFSTKQTSEQGAAAGVGLATVRRIVRGYGGGIRLESEEGRGTAFHIYLPVERKASTGKPTPVVVAEAESSTGGGARILVVEDDPQVREIVERTLTDAGHAVSAVGTAEEALQIFDRVRPPFDLLLADVVLPDRPGPQLYRALARRVPDLPVLYVSGYGEEAVARRGGNGPGIHFLAKPFSPEELRTRVREILVARGKSADESRTRESGNAGA